MDNRTGDIIKVIDFWHGSLSTGEVHNRSILDAIDMSSREVIDISGPRRSGKSSLFKLIIKRLGLKDNFLYINFEDPFFVLNDSPEIIEELISVYREYFSQGLEYLFFDEIQEIRQWERAVRKLRDGSSCRIFITGSSSTLMSGEISSLLTGRHLSYRVFPVSFREFLSFREFDIGIKKDLVLRENALLRMFDEYCRYGGFPEVVLTRNEGLLKTYFFDILQKDIIVRHDVRDKTALERIAVFVISNAAKTISIESLRNTYTLSASVVSSYLEYLREAFLIFEIPRFSYSLKQQAKSLKKYYPVDPGLANAVSFRFTEDKGRALESVVFLELQQRGGEVYYYKTTNNLEVDFLVREGGAVKQLIQVTWSMDDPKTAQREIKALIQAMEELKMEEGTILTFGEERIVETSGKKILIKSVWKWLLD